MAAFKILGPLEVTGDHGPIALGAPKQRALVALLLLHADETLSTDRIVDELWSGKPPKTATTSLWNLVTQLRKVLPAEALVTKPGGYALQIGDHELDYRGFEQLVQEARRVDGKRKSELLQRALDLWRGPALSDLAFESFASSEIGRLNELRLLTIEERVDVELEGGAGGELVPELERLVRENPLRERLRGQLMLALYRSGRQADALQEYLTARRVLVDELGIEPGPSLQRLYRSILRQESSLERSPPPSVAEDHLADVVGAALAGRLVLVLGAGADREGTDGGTGLPGPAEMVAHLLDAFDCPPDQPPELARIAEYVALTKGVGPLYDEIHQLFDREYTPGAVHNALAALEQPLHDRGAPHLLVITTSFHELLENALQSAGHEADVVSYLATGRYQGKYLHSTPHGSSVVVDAPYAYTDISLERRGVVLKIHGGVDRRPEREWESFVISEDDYIGHFMDADLAAALPVTLAARLRRSHFLFLGYPLQEWNLRVFLHRVWGREKVSYRSWAIAAEPNPIEQELWRQRGIDIFDVPLLDYLARLGARLDAERADDRP
jgi:DNA-binding SARP family transcriptional activator